MRAATFRRPALLACVFLILTVLVAPAVAAAATFSPDLFEEPAGPLPGTNCSPPAPIKNCTLRGAITVANAGDTIQLQAGTYKLSSVGQLNITKQLTILGAGPGATTIEAGTAGQSRVVNVVGGVGLTMTGLKITGGEVIGEDGADGTTAGEKGGAGKGVEGAGINTSGPLTLTEVVVTGNKLIGGNGGAGAAGGANSGSAGGGGGFTDGAGIESGGGLVTLDRVAITGNEAQPGVGGKGGNAGTNGVGGAGGLGGAGGGGGIDGGTGSSLVATDTLIADNVVETGAGGAGGAGGANSGTGGAGGQGEASSGGGMFSNGSVKLTNVTFVGNLAAGGTGGPGGKGGGTTVAEVGGAGGFGGGGQGGAIAFFTGAVGQFASVTIAGNKAGGAVGGAGGVGSHGGTAGAAGAKGSTEGGNVFLTNNATLSIRGTVIAGGEAEAGKENCVFGATSVLTSLGHNLEDHHQCLTKPAAGDLINTPAGLGPLAANGGPTETMALLSGSAAIDAGEPACVDAVGAPLAEDQRGDPRGTPCDIGAFEVQPESPAEPGGSGEPSSPSEPGAGNSGGGGATPGGGASDGSKSSTTPAPVTLGRLKLSPKAVRDGKKSTISFSLSGADRVNFTLQRDAAGVRAGKRCVAPRPGAPGKHCKRLIVAHGAPRALSAAGAVDHLAWTPKGLAAGAYVLTAAPAGGKAATLMFNVH
jgi:hypothetical protein